MKKNSYHFEIDYQQYLDQTGYPTQDLPEFAKDPNLLIELYAAMIRNRVFDTKAIALQRTGKMGTYPSTLGQEAIGVAIGSTMKPEDVLCPYYREYAAQFWRGVKMREILLYWGGDERGSCFQSETAKQDFPICVPIASQTLHAVGVASAFKIKQEPRVAVAVIGDGGTSRGDFYESINLAGVWNLPVVFVINNNQWAISVSRKDQSGAETLAQKGIAGGLHCEQVDGNDVIAMKIVLDRALQKARAGQGPTVIEAITYRLCDHTTADDAKRYRNEEDLSTHRANDPIKRLNAYLVKLGVWDENKEKALQERAVEEVKQEVDQYLAMSARPPETMFDHLYAKLPEAYLSQREEAARLPIISKHGKNHG